MNYPTLIVALLLCLPAQAQRRELAGIQSFEGNDVTGWLDYGGSAISGWASAAPGLVGDLGSASAFRLDGTWTATENAAAGASYQLPDQNTGITFCSAYIKTQTGDTQEGLSFDLGHANPSTITTPMIRTVFGKVTGQIVIEDSTGDTNLQSFTADTEYRLEYRVDWAAPTDPVIDILIDGVARKTGMTAASTLHDSLSFIAFSRATPDSPAATARVDQVVCETDDVQSMTDGFDSIHIGSDPDHTSSDALTTKPHKTLFSHDSDWWMISWDGGTEATTGGWYVYRWDDPGVWRSRSDRITNEADHRMDAFWDGTNLFVAAASETQNRLFKLSYSSADSWWDNDSNTNINGDMTPTSINPINISIVGDTAGRLWTFWHTDDGATGSLRYEVRLKSSLALVGAGDRLIDSTLDDDDLMSAIHFTDGSGEKIGVLYSDQTVPEMLFLARLVSGDPEAAWGSPETVNNTANYSDDHPDIVSDDVSNELYAVWKTGLSGTSDDNIIFKRRNSGGTWEDEAVVWTRFGGAGQEYTRPRIVFDDTNNELYVFSTRVNTGGDIYYKKSSSEIISFGSEVKVIDHSSDLINNVSVPKLAVTDQILPILAQEQDGTDHQFYAIIELAVPALRGSAIDGGSYP